MEEIVNLRGGARIDSFNASWPLATLKADQKKIIIGIPFKTYELKKENIKTLSIHKGIISRGVKFEHNQNELPKKLIFWTPNLSEVKIELEKIGYIFISE